MTPRRHLQVIAGCGPNVKTSTARNREEAGETTPPAELTELKLRTAAPDSVSYYLGLSDLFRIDDIAMIVVCAAAAYFSAHVAFAIRSGAGPWAVFGGGL